MTHSNTKTIHQMLPSYCLPSIEVCIHTRYIKSEDMMRHTASNDYLISVV